MWTLPDRRYTLTQFLTSFYDRSNQDGYTFLFDRKRVLDNLAGKIRHIRGSDKELLDRSEVEYLYPQVRVQYWMGPNHTLDASLSHALLPYIEPRFTIPSAEIPIAYKNMGRLEGAVMCQIDPKLASYPSVYGFDFTGVFPVKARLIDWCRLHLPLALHSWGRWRILHPPSSGPMPPHLSREYLGVFFDFKKLQVARYIDVDRIRRPDLLSRALTLELLLTDRF